MYFILIGLAVLVLNLYYFKQDQKKFESIMGIIIGLLVIVYGVLD